MKIASAVWFACYLFASAAVWLVASERSAHASFPGNNGKIAFSSFRDALVEEQIFVMRQDGSRVRQLPMQGHFVGAPEWSPDGKHIAFSASDTDLEPRSDVYVMNADGSGIANVTDTPEDAIERSPHWYPSGRRIAFCAAPPRKTRTAIS